MQQARRRGPPERTGLATTGRELVPAKDSSGRRSSNGPITRLCKFIKGGKKTFMEMAQFAGQIEPKLQPIIESYEALTPAGKNGVDIDALCQVNDVDPAHFMAVVAEAAHKFSENSSILVAALSMPSVVEKSIKQALKPSGDKDRKMLFQHAGFIPTPGGTNINVLARAQASAQARDSAAEKGMSSFEDDVIDVD